MRRSSLSTALAALALLALGAGCSSAPELGPPILESIEPASGPVGEAVAVTVRGSGFFVHARQALGSASAEVDASFSLSLGGVALADVQRVDERTLTAVVPTTLAAGRHALELRGPYGTASLADAYEALPQSGARLVAEIAAPAECNVGQRIEIAVEAQNTGTAAAIEVSAALAVEPLAIASGPKPANVRVEPGTSERLLFTVDCTSPGEAPLSATVAGKDERDGSPIEASAATSLWVVRSAQLFASLEPPGTFSVGQQLAVELRVSNEGQTAALGVVPAATLAGDGEVELLAAPDPSDIGAGETVPFVWTYRATGAGAVAVSATAEGTDKNTGEPVALAQALETTLRIERPATLLASATASPAVVGVGERVTVRLVVENTGEAAAAVVVPSMVTAGTGSATLLEEPTGLPADLAGGAQVELVWEYAAAASGTLTFEAGARARDVNSAEVISATAEPQTVTVSGRPVLVGSLHAPQVVNAGQEIVLELEVTNSGEAAAVDLTPSATVTGTAGATLVEGPVPPSATIAGAGAQTFSWRFVAAGEGVATFTVDGVGSDEVDGATVSLLPISAEVEIVLPAALEAELTAPESVTAGSTFTVTLVVRNTGGARALDVTPGTLVIGGTGAGTLLSSPPPYPMDLANGTGGAFIWEVQAGALGEITLDASATGRDANDGKTLSVSASAQVRVSEIVELFDDPFGDGTSFAFVFTRAGKLYLGPDKNGAGAVRANLDGSAPESVAFAFARDSRGGNTSENAAAPPYPSLGSTGCAANTHACGPDNENGRGLFTSGSFASNEWLIAGGSKSVGGLDYVYMSVDHDALLDFAYVDLDATGLTGQTKSLSSACVHGDRVYLGFPDRSGNRPFLLALLRPPPSPGLDAVVGVDVLQLAADHMPDIGRAATLTMIDSMVAFGDRLYLFNNGGCARATTASPGPCSTNPGDWTRCTPAAPEWSAKTSVTVTDAADLTPADKAVPQVAVHQGRLYLARNTTTGPQLWACSPELSGDTTQCEPQDWSLIASNSTGDAQLSQFDNPNNAKIALLVSTGDALYVGFDNAVEGAVVFRSSLPAPAARSDFEGRAACAADAHPAACEGAGGNGLGDARNTRIFSGVGVSLSGSGHLYLTTGDGSGPVRVVRIDD
ncbi:MAG: hypothetical protein ACOX6T_21110 [Myxococcales bacterium]